MTTHTHKNYDWDFKKLLKFDKLLLRGNLSNEYCEAKYEQSKSYFINDSNLHFVFHRITDNVCHGHRECLGSGPLAGSPAYTRCRVE